MSPVVSSATATATAAATAHTGASASLFPSSSVSVSRLVESADRPEPGKDDADDDDSFDLFAVAEKQFEQQTEVRSLTMAPSAIADPLAVVSNLAEVTDDAEGYYCR
jgi:hypothetical protein